MCVQKVCFRDYSTTQILKQWLRLSKNRHEFRGNSDSFAHMNAGNYLLCSGSAKIWFGICHSYIISDVFQTGATHTHTYLENMPVDNRSSWIFHHFLPVFEFQPCLGRTKTVRFCSVLCCFHVFVCTCVSFTFAIVAKLYPTNGIRAADSIVVSHDQFQAHSLNNTGYSTTDRH